MSLTYPSIPKSALICISMLRTQTETSAKLVKEVFVKKCSSHATQSITNKQLENKKNATVYLNETKSGSDANATSRSG